MHYAALDALIVVILLKEMAKSLENVN